MIGILLALLTTTVTHAAIIREDIGELKIHDLLIRPNFTFADPKKGAFSIGESSFALRWELEQRYAGVVRIGPRALLNPLAHFTPAVNDDIMLVEAFGEYSDWFGRFRMGRLPIEFGFEGKLWERNLIFPRSLLYQRRAMMLRDVGFSYEIQHNNVYTGFVLHDGESEGANSDGEIWYTGRWGFRNEDFEVGFTGQTGSTKTVSTENSEDTLAGVNPKLNAKWRIGGVYAASLQKGWGMVGEYYIGELEQENGGGKFYAGHLDAGLGWSKTFETYVRFDVFDPNSNDSSDLEQHASVALVLANRTHSSNLILVGTKVLDHAKESGHDELRLIWSLSPSGVVRF